MKKLIISLIILCAATAVRAGDVDMKMTTADGTTKVTFQDSAAVEVSSITSDGNAYFNSVTQLGTGGNVILSQQSLQPNATFYVSSGTVNTQLNIGTNRFVSGGGAGSDNYTAYPFSSAGAITAKQCVLITGTGVAATTVASSGSVVGIAVSATSGAGQTVWVATEGIVTNVTCTLALNVGVRACSSATAGQITTCASATNDGVGVGKMLTACAATGTGTILLGRQ